MNLNNLPFQPNLLLIAGQQQNVGKTTLACNIIAKFSREEDIAAFKVSPHFHQSTGDAKVIEEGDGFQILEETTFKSNKDTSRMLKAGAIKAFLLQTTEKALPAGLNALFKLVSKDQMIICESAGVRDYIEPAVFLVLRQVNCKVCSIEDDELFNKADRIVTFSMNSFDISLDELSVDNSKWMLKPNP
jgi:hypothetical protein